MSAGARIVRCPGCAGESVYDASNRYRPFCSARCKNNDLGAWATESYRIPAQPRAGQAPNDIDPENPGSVASGS